MLTKGTTKPLIGSSLSRVYFVSLQPISLSNTADSLGSDAFHQWLKKNVQRTRSSAQVLFFSRTLKISSCSTSRWPYYSPKVWTC
jgi:hypothetical protein